MSQDENKDMSAERDIPMMAAEYSLGLLEGEELLDARGREASDPEFAWRKAWWDNWFAPFTDDMAGMEPSEKVWAQIKAQVDSSAGADAGAGAEVVTLQVAQAEARARRWQWTAGITSAAAAVLLAVLVFSPGTGPSAPINSPEAPQLADAAPLVGQVPVGDEGLRLDVTYLPQNEELLVGAIGLTADGVHDHELWLVPADGSALQSLGVVVPGEVRRIKLSRDVIGNVSDGVGLVVTREPIGGKPKGVDAGPVVAQGALSAV